jgi:DNA transposition AAA+ family ATPase
MIYGVAKWVQKINAIGLVTGPAGCGKTICAQAVRAETPGAIFITVTTASQSKLAVLESLVRAMRITGITLTAKGYESLLIERLTGTNRLIIVDEAHKLAGRRNDEALHMLRDLHS